MYDFAVDDRSKSPREWAEHLLMRLPDKEGRHVAMDNLFSYPEMFKRLRRTGLEATGTWRSNHRVPKEFMSDNLPLERGQWCWASKDGLFAYVWMDSSRVYFLSTLIAPYESPVMRRQSGVVGRLSVPAPYVATVYNQTMNGVDLADQRRAVRTTNRRARKWWHSIWWWTVDTALFNAYVIWTALDKARGKHAFTWFCEQVAAEMLDLGDVDLVRPKKKVRHSDADFPPITKYAPTHRHLPVTLDSRGRCPVCWREAGKEVRTKVHCETCHVALCPGACYQSYHSNFVFK